jgi:hypothetical protein
VMCAHLQTGKRLALYKATQARTFRHRALADPTKLI